MWLTTVPLIAVVLVIPPMVIADDQPPVHPGFVRCRVAQLTDPDGAAFYLDGRRVPYSFEVSTLFKANPEFPDEPAPPGWLKFVLVVPGKISLDFTPKATVELSVERPFYVATTTLSQRHAANLSYGSMLLEEDAYGLYSKNFSAHMLKGFSPDEVVPAVKRYLANDALPALIASPGAGRFYADRLTIATGMEVRLPTIAEWYLAMRAGSDTRYWWGNEWDDSKVVKPVGPNPPTDMFDYLDAVAPVNSGEPNALGLHYVIGNVSQVVDLSDAEVEALRVAAQKVNEDRSLRIYNGIRKRTSVLVGGSVIDSERAAEHCSVDIHKIVGGLGCLFRGQFTAAWDEPILGPINYFQMVGVRLVIEIPTGQFEIRRE